MGHTEDSAGREADRLTDLHFGKRARGKTTKEFGSKEIIEVKGIISHIEAVLSKNNGWVFLAWIVNETTNKSAAIPLGEVEFLSQSRDMTAFSRVPTLVLPVEVTRFSSVRFT